MTVSTIEWPTLATGDRNPIRKRTVALHFSQAEIVDAAIKLATAQGPYDALNPNVAGNAIARIAQAYLDARR